MKEITFQISYNKQMDAKQVTILEDGIVRTSSYYHKDTDDGVAIAISDAEWYGVDLDTLYK